MLNLLHIPNTLRCSLYLSFAYVIANTPHESGRQFAIVFYILLVTFVDYIFDLPLAAKINAARESMGINVRTHVHALTMLLVRTLMELAIAPRDGP